LIRGYFLHGAGYLVANRLFHPSTVRFGHQLRNCTWPL
jgi:hypothetical protein